MKDLSFLPKARGGRSGLLPDTEPRFIQVLVEAWARDLDDSKPTALGTPFRHSDAGSCGRAITYTAAGIPASDPMDLSGVWNVGLGQRLHDLWQAELLARYPGAEVEVKVRTQGADGSGHIDAVIDIKETDHDGPLDPAAVLAEGEAGPGDGMLGLDGLPDAERVRPADGRGGQHLPLRPPSELRDVPESDPRGSGDRPPLSEPGVCEPGAPGSGDDGGEPAKGGGGGRSEQTQDPLPTGTSVLGAESSDHAGRGPSVSDLRSRPKAPGVRRIAIELKSIGGWGFKAAIGLAKGDAEGPKTSHLLQAALNGLGCDADEVVVSYLSKEAVSKAIADRHNLSELERFCCEWTFTRDQYEELGRKEAARVNGLLGLVAEGTLGRRNVPYDMTPGAEIQEPATGAWTEATNGKVLAAGKQWTCGYCKYQSICMMTPPGRIPVADVRAVAVATGLLPGDAA